MREFHKAITRLSDANAFSLIEALMAVSFLGLLAVAASAVYTSGFQSLDDQTERMLLDGKLRSRMEVLLAAEFSSLSSGSEVVTIDGKSYTINWNVAVVDLNNDSIPEVSAKEVTVSVEGMNNRSLTTIIVNNEGRTGKVS
jgi:hypothetical protein